MTTFETIDAYIASFPPDVRPTLEAVRATMRDATPGTEEAISYGIPTFMLNGKQVVYLAGWKRHISVYPIPGGDPALDAELAPYKAAKGTLRFPLDRPIPLDLIGKVAAQLLRARVEAG
ncbi:MAG TPA: DUF1801 domain-containing protein [Candidatus Eisenbacteria bacterium]|nr:DUF1801 domain-containing protein [Candidatus Eisenbacteria bacterium]